MNLHPIFKFRERTTQGVIDLLDSTVLGTNGAKYRHADTKEKIEQCDNLVHLTMERNEKVLGNISFCRREENWYIRYFAFRISGRSAGTKRSKANDGFLRTQLEQFFDDVFNGEFGENVEQFYAYIDPANQRSLWMSENFKFETVGKIATQTFSRSRPKKQRVERLEHATEEIRALIEQTYSNDQFYTDVQWSKGPFYILKNDKNEIVACSRFYIARWEFERLPGKMGGILTKLIPFIPLLRKIIRPKDHTFIVPEAVVVKNNEPNILTQLFEGMLFDLGQNLILWWIDHRQPVYQEVVHKVKWGLLNKIIGVHDVNVVNRKKEGSENCTSDHPVYTVGLDFI